MVYSQQEEESAVGYQRLKPGMTEQKLWLVKSLKLWQTSGSSINWSNWKILRCHRDNSTKLYITILVKLRLDQKLQNNDGRVVITRTGRLMSRKWTIRLNLSNCIWDYMTIQHIYDIYWSALYCQTFRSRSFTHMTSFLHWKQAFWNYLQCYNELLSLTLLAFKKEKHMFNAHHTTSGCWESLVWEYPFFTVIHPRVYASFI